MPYGEPRCSANSSNNNEYPVLSCTWDSGFPRALLWWSSSSEDIKSTSELNTNTLALRFSANYSGKTFVCHAKHPLAKESKQCSLKLGKTCLRAGLRAVVSFSSLPHDKIVQKLFKEHDKEFKAFTCHPNLICGMCWTNKSNAFRLPSQLASAGSAAYVFKPDITRYRGNVEWSPAVLVAQIGLHNIL